MQTQSPRLENSAQKLPQTASDPKSAPDLSRTYHVMPIWGAKFKTHLWEGAGGRQPPVVFLRISSSS